MLPYRTCILGCRHLPALLSFLLCEFLLLLCKLELWEWREDERLVERNYMHVEDNVDFGLKDGLT